MTEKNKMRLAEVCNKYYIEIDRAQKSYEFLRRTHNRTGEDALVDYLEQRVKMLHFRAITELPGESEVKA